MRLRWQNLTDGKRSGKGENSWDCDEDAIYSSTFPADSLVGAITHMHDSAMRARRKYGDGAAWRPTRGPHARSGRENQPTRETR